MHGDRAADNVDVEAAGDARDVHVGASRLEPHARATRNAEDELALSPALLGRYFHEHLHPLHTLAGRARRRRDLRASWDDAAQLDAVLIPPDDTEITNGRK